MKVRYSVTFEFDKRPGACHRGIVEGAAASTCARRAVLEAQNALKPVNWDSVVCVLLERLDSDAVSSSEEDNADDVETAEFTEPG